MIDRINRGEHVVITRDGEPVAELRPLRRRPPSPAALLDRWQHLPPIDRDRFRSDVDAIIDQSL